MADMHEMQPIVAWKRLSKGHEEGPPCRDSLTDSHKHCRE